MRGPDGGIENDSANEKRTIGLYGGDVVGKCEICVREEDAFESWDISRKE